MGIPIAPDDIVQTPADGEANSRPPLLVLEPLGAFLDAHGIGAGGSRPTGTGLGAQDSVPQVAAKPAPNDRCDHRPWAAAAIEGDSSSAPDSGQPVREPGLSGVGAARVTGATNRGA